MEQAHPREGKIQKALLSKGDSLFFKPKPQQPPNAIHYVVSFLSPRFLLYIKCPKIPYSQLARSQEDPKTIIDGAAERQVYPVLLYSSRNEAEEYATDVLGLQPKKIYFTEPGFWSLWRTIETFEVATLPVETIQVHNTLNVAPVVHVKEPSTQMNSVHTLPFRGSAKKLTALARPPRQAAAVRRCA